MAKPFISGRIPVDLDAKIVEHSEATGESRTEILINALSKYLDFDPESKSLSLDAKDRLSLLEKRVADLEKSLNEPKQFSLLDIELPKPKEPAKLEITADNKSDNKPNAKANPLKGELVASKIKTPEIYKLPGLESEDLQKMKTKLNNTTRSTKQQTVIGPYLIVFLPPAATNDGKRRELFWDVYLAK